MAESGEKKRLQQDSHPAPKGRLRGPSQRSAIEPFIVMDVMRAAADREHSGGRVIHMEVGQPAAPAPKAVIAAAEAALRRGRIAYTEALGIRALRARIARYYAEQHGLDVPSERIVVTTGSSAGFNLAFLAAFDVGDRIALAAPGYPAYRNLLGALGLDVVEIPVDAETRYALTPALIEQVHRDRPLAGVLIASPANPSGTVMEPAALDALIAAAEEMGVTFISDEIYHRLVYNGAAATALQFSDGAIVVNSFSKYYCMTGWRVGWMVVPEPLVRPIERLQQNLSISVPTLSQIAAEAAFEGRAEMEAIKHGYEENRRILIEGLPKAGLDTFLPADGAFYLYADVSKFTSDSFAFAGEMLEKARVAATPGVDFDPVHGRAFIRFSYARSAEEMHEAVAGIARWLA